MSQCFTCSYSQGPLPDSALWAKQHFLFTSRYPTLTTYHSSNAESIAAAKQQRKCESLQTAGPFLLRHMQHMASGSVFDELSVNTKQKNNRLKRQYSWQITAVSLHPFFYNTAAFIQKTGTFHLGISKTSWGFILNSTLLDFIWFEIR